ncbi:MAG: hypothetical protein JNM40_00070 [Myxococcales bacterium]|nr:hypothetical protein [Myxococcales bacterium]
MSQKQKTQSSPLPKEVQSEGTPARSTSQAAILGILSGERARKQASDANGSEDKRCDAEWALGVEWTLRMMS